MSVPRMEVLAFSLLMERELRANDGRPGWKRDLPADLAKRVVEEARDLQAVVAAWAAGGHGRYAVGEIAKIGKEAADVANMAMMVADVCGALVMLAERPGGDA